ncbi:MAG TPA: radical SAM protein [Patescibacteria group bacterium]|nr:radical SAM protein [Patescibacteria group bacterium]
MHIAFIAMSGVRAASEELNRIGLTMPGFVERSRVIASLPSLGLLTLAGLTPDDVEVSYHEIADIRTMGELPTCDVAAIASFSAQIKDAYVVADQYRALGVRVVLGGLHVTARPDEAAQHADAIVIGEGEITWPQVVEDLRAGRLQPRYAPDGREFDLAASPMPRFDLLDIDRYNRLTVQTQRGCPWRCEFCASSIRLTPMYKLKPVDRVIAEIREIKRLWPAPFIEFADDNTFVNRRHSKELLRAVAGEGIRWFTETDVSVADDPELLELLRESGCAEVLIGFESPTAAGLEGIELRRNWKRSRVADYRAAIERIQGHGIAVNACFVLGLDGDGPEVFDAVYDFVQQARPFDVQVTALTPFPGTPMYDRLLAEGRLLEPTAWERCTLFDVNFRPTHMSPEALQHDLVELGRRLYTDEQRAFRRRSLRAHRRAFLREARERRMTA